MKRKIIIAVLAVVIVLIGVLSGCAGAEGENLVANGEFRAVDSVVKGWNAEKAGSTYGFVENAAGSDGYLADGGTHYAHLSASSKSYAYLSQTVKLRKDATYHLKASVRVVKLSSTNDIGARVGFVEDTDFVGINATQANGDWRTYDVYFVSKTDKEMTLTVGLGSASDKASGEAYFDNIVLERVRSVPDGVTVGQVKNKEDLSLSDGVSISFVVLFAIGSVVLSYALYFVYRKLTAKEQGLLGGAQSGKDEKLTGVAKAMTSPFAMFMYIMLGAFAVRFVSLLTTYGMGGLVDSYVDIGKIAAEKGLLNVMTGDNAVNQPAGLVWVMSLLGMLADAIGIEHGSLGFAILVRLPNIIADIVVCYMIYGFVQRHQSERQAAVFTAIYAFVPVFFVFGTLYGSAESVAIAFCVAMMISIVHNRHIAAGCFYTAALLFSNNMLLLLPIIALYQIVALVTDPKARIQTAATMIGSFVVFYALNAILQGAEIGAGNVLYPFKKMYTFFAASKMVCTDSLNLYAIFGGANSLVRNTLLDVANWMFVLTMATLAAVHYVRSRNRLDLVLMSSFIVCGYAVLGAASNVAILPMGIVLLLMYVALVPDRRLYGVGTSLATLSFLNLAQLLSVNGYLTATESGTDIAFASKSAFLIVFSILAVATVFYYLYVTATVAVYGRTDDIQPMTRKFRDEMRYLVTFQWARGDRD